MAEWTFFTNHGHVIFILNSYPKMPLREVANRVASQRERLRKSFQILKKMGLLKLRKKGEIITIKSSEEKNLDTILRRIVK